MAEANPIQANFTAGEVSGELAGRIDTETYAAALNKMENFIPIPQGPAEFRPGTNYVATCKTIAEKARLIPFQYSTIQAYILEIGDGYIRFYKDHTQITYETLEVDTGPAPGDFSGTITGTSSGTTAKIVSGTGTDYVIQSRDGDFTDGEVLDDGTNSLDCAAGYPIIGVGDPYEVASPWLEDVATGVHQVMAIQYAQAANVMFLVHESHPVQKLERQSHNKWTLTAKSTAGGSAFTAEGGDDEDFDAVEHYPSCVTFHDERLILAGTINDPQTIWGSVVEDWENFTTGDSTGLEAFEYTPASDRVDAIRWLISHNVLLFGTVGGEWKGDDLAPDTLPTLKRQSAFGSKHLQAVMLSDTAFYFQRTGRRIQEIRFDYDSDSYMSREVTLLAGHITGTGGIVDRGYQQEPNPTLWCVRSDGEIAIMTFDRRQGIAGWSRFTTLGNFESLAAITATSEDEVWVLVKRTINGSDTRYIEYFKPRDWGADNGDVFFVDSGLSFDGGAAKTITNMTVADPVVVTSAAHGISNNSFVRIRTVCGLTECNDKVYKVKNVAANTFELWQQDGTDGIDGTAYTAYVADIDGDTTRASTTIDGISAADIAALVKGCGIAGAGIPTGATVIAIGTDSITISAEATATASAVTLTVSGTATVVAQTVSNLSHLEAASVVASVDGAAHSSRTVASGAITLDNFYNKINAGLPYDGVLQTMQIEAGATKGTAQGKLKSMTEIVTRLKESLGGWIGPDADNLEPVVIRTGADVMGKPPSLKTGDVESNWRGGSETEGRIYFLHNQPLPMMVVAFMPEMITYD